MNDLSSRLMRWRLILEDNTIECKERTLSTNAAALSRQVRVFLVVIGKDQDISVNEDTEPKEAYLKLERHITYLSKGVCYKNKNVVN